MKKIPLVFFSLFLLFVGCQHDTVVSTLHNGKHTLLATTAMIGDLVQELGGDYVDVGVLIPSALDPHSYVLVKGDGEKFASAEHIFYNGLGLEHSITLRRQLTYYSTKATCVTSALLEQTPSPLLKVDGLYDPHVWMDVSLWTQTLTPICNALCELIPEHSDYFLMRKELLEKKMVLADQKAYETLQELPSDKRFLVTSHDAFNYFTRRYLSDKNERDWQKRCHAPEGLAPEAELATIDLLDVLAYIKEHKTKVLFTESNLNAQGVRKLLDAGHKEGLSLRLSQKALYADSMGEAHSYLEMVQHNVEVIKKELSQ